MECDINSENGITLENNFWGYACIKSKKNKKLTTVLWFSEKNLLPSILEDFICV